ncbi:MAG TPA: 3-phosphoshikimate 1-carboxyvinyltransferase [Polyangiales bacterium]|nr:3-phosphoshikimate 1-carboxyvinyltransferase [Polyangiales bacterium]
MSLSDKLEIRPLSGPLHAPAVRVPGSKSISNRALLLAGLAEGQSQLRGTLDSDDTRVMIAALRALGARIEVAADGGTSITGVAGKLRVPEAVIDVGASGTAARFLTATLALVPGPTRLDGITRMRQRPIQDLVDALNALGAKLSTESPGGCPPVVSKGGGLGGGEVTVDASRSSQYVSAVLQVAPYAARDTVLKLKDGVLVSKPYVDVTLGVMHDFGADVGFLDASTLQVSAANHYRGRDYTIEPDASTAAYFFAAAALSGGYVRVVDLPGKSAQADMRVLDVFERMGAMVRRGPNSVELQGPAGGLNGVEVDMNDMPDAVLALAVAAAFAKSETVIRNVANLRIKETDRLQALEAELQRLGAGAEAGPDWLRIRPGQLRAATIETYDDHRMAMAFALAGLKVPGIVIKDPACVSKSWPKYFDTFQALSAKR